MGQELRRPASHTGVMPMPDDLLRRLRSAIAGADDWYVIERDLTRSITDGEADAARAAAYAFGYMLVSPSQEELRDRAGVFAPRLEWTNGSSFPPYLRDVTEDILAQWQELYEALDDDASRSRLGDLLWVTQHGSRPVDAARAACTAYVALIARDEWQIMDRVDGAGRALELASEINDRSLRDAYVSATLCFVENELDEAIEHRPGVPLRLLQQLASLPTAARPASLPDLVTRARDRYGDDPFISETLTELELALAGDDEKDELRAAQVRRWREAASRATGLARLAHMRHALELARSTGQSATADEIAREIQEIPPEELDLKQHSVSIEFPAEHVDAMVASFAKHDNAEQALGRFGTSGPPTGDAHAIDSNVADLARRFPLQRLITRQVLGENNSLIFEAQGDDDHDRIDRAQHAALGIQLFGPVAVRILAEIRSACPAPTADTLTAFFTTELVDMPVGTRLAHGVTRHWEGDHDAAALILVTQIEAAIRGIAAHLGIPVTKPPRSATPGGVVACGALLAKLEGRLDESWRRYLFHLLVDPLSANLRNRLAHGLLDAASASESAVLVHAACFLRSLTISERRTNDPE